MPSTEIGCLAFWLLNEFANGWGEPVGDEEVGGGSSFQWIPRWCSPSCLHHTRLQLLAGGPTLESPPVFKSQIPPSPHLAWGPTRTSQGPALAFVIPLHPAHKF